MDLYSAIDMDFAMIASHNRAEPIQMSALTLIQYPVDESPITFVPYVPSALRSPALVAMSWDGSAARRAHVFDAPDKSSLLVQ